MNLLQKNCIFHLLRFLNSNILMRHRHLFYILLINYFIPSTFGSITVVSQFTNQTILVFDDQPARFVPERVSYYGIQGYVVYANPPNACTPVEPPPAFGEKVNWILLARRSSNECGFQRKIENAQNAGYAAILVHNVGSNSTEAMGAEDPSRLVIYACFIGEYFGHLLRDNYSYPADKGFQYYIRIQDDLSLNGYLLPFAIVVGVCFVVMLIFMLWQQVVRWVRERRRSRRRKLPTSALKKLPITKWTKADPYETCAVCLEDFVEHDKIRVLPCSHGYHAVCIDPWLTKGRRVCPICKRKVVLAEERFSESDTDTEDETAPLLGNASTSGSRPNPVTAGSTFVQQRENPFRRARRRAIRRRSSQQPNQSLNSPTMHVQPPNPDPETTSTSSEETFQHSSSTVQSVPIIAQVHSSGSTSSFICGDIPSGSRAPFPSLQTSISHRLQNQSTEEEYHPVGLPEVFVISKKNSQEGNSFPSSNTNARPNDNNGNEETSERRGDTSVTIENSSSSDMNVNVKGTTNSSNKSNSKDRKRKPDDDALV